jgi:hypothetical protein
MGAFGCKNENRVHYYDLGAPLNFGCKSMLQAVFVQQKVVNIHDCDTMFVAPERCLMGNNNYFFE